MVEPAGPHKAATTSVTSFFFAVVRCACCDANISGTKDACGKCHSLINEAYMVGRGFWIQMLACAVGFPIRWLWVFLAVIPVSSCRFFVQ